MSTPFKLKQGWVTRAQLLKLYANREPNKARKIIAEMQEKSRKLCEIAVERQDGNHSYAYAPKFVAVFKEKMLAIEKVKYEIREYKGQFLTTVELGKKLHANAAVVKEVIEKYGIGKDTNLVDKSNDNWLIHKSLESELSFHMVPAGPVIRGRATYGGRRPSLDDYDGNFS